jgi:hypothetical protein
MGAASKTPRHCLPRLSAHKLSLSPLWTSACVYPEKGPTYKGLHPKGVFLYKKHCFLAKSLMERR